MGWTEHAIELAALDPGARAVLERLTPMELPSGTTLFEPGESVKGYVVVLSGGAAVSLLGPNGRDILLYEVTPGHSCIQSTLGLLGGTSYSGLAETTAHTKLIVIPPPVFMELTESSSAFRKVVFSAFAERMKNMMQLIENVSFMSIEARLAALILDREEGGALEMTQADMARAIGTAREVVTRQLGKLTKTGVIRAERGVVHVINARALEALISDPAL